jgi:hypothetical protein
VRTYGRIFFPNHTYQWVEVDTQADGNNDAVYLTTLAQVLLLNLNESPFYANYGIPAHPAVVQQVFPDFYVTRTQQQFSGRFASIIISKDPLPTPTYEVAVTTHSGTKLGLSVPI